MWYNRFLAVALGKYISYPELVLLISKLPINITYLEEVDNIISSFIKIHKGWWGQYGKYEDLAASLRRVFIEEGILVELDGLLYVNKKVVQKLPIA